MLLFYCLSALAFSAWLLRFNYFFTGDGVAYALLGQSIVAGKGMDVNWGAPYVNQPPLYPVLIGLANLFFKDLEFSGHVVSIFAFSLTLIPLYLLSREIYPPPTSHWVSLLYATHGFLLIYSNLVLTEPLFLLGMTLELYLVHRMIQGKATRAAHGFLLGVLGGLCYLTRPEGFLYYLAGAFSFLLLSSRPWPFRIRVVSLSLFTFLIFFLPYVRFIHQSTHKFQLSGLAIKNIIMRQLDVSHPNQYLEVKKIYEGLTADNTRPKMEELIKNFRLLDYLKKDDFAFLRAGFRSALARFLGLSNYLYGGIGFFFLGASFLCAPWDERRRKSELLLILFLAPFLPQLFLAFDARRYLPLFPILLLWTGQGVEVLRNWAKGSFRLGRKGSCGVALGVCFLFALPSASYLHRVIKNTDLPIEHKELGQWMRKNIPGIEKEWVVSQSPFIYFYAGAKMARLPYVEKFEDFLAFMAHRQARYFVASQDLEPPVLDSYRFLLDERRPPPRGISRRYVLSRKRKMILYEIEK